MARVNENLSVRIPPKMREDLDRLATSMERSRNWVITEAIEQFLEQHQWQIDLIEARLAKAEGDEAGFSAHDDVMDRIEAKIHARLS